MRRNLPWLRPFVTRRRVHGSARPDFRRFGAWCSGKISRAGAPIKRNCRKRRCRFPIRPMQAPRLRLQVCHQRRREFYGRLNSSIKNLEQKGFSTSINLSGSTMLIKSHLTRWWAGKINHSANIAHFTCTLLAHGNKTLVNKWSGRRESNPRVQFGRLPFYH
jgi:hypothetical protein